MRKKRIKSILCLLVLFSGLFGKLNNLNAAESTGGEVSRTSKITFYEGEQQPAPPISPEPELLEPPKPKPNILPQTSESKNDHLFLGGILLLLTGILVWFKKRQVAKT